jgi:hypothetical protein
MNGMTSTASCFQGLTVLIAVVEAGTIARAAEALGLKRGYDWRLTFRISKPMGCTPEEKEACDCIDFYDVAKAKPYGWEVRRRKEVTLR